MTEPLGQIIDPSTLDEGASNKDIHDRMRKALDLQLLGVLESGLPASAAILTAAIKRVEQLGKEIATDPADDMADTIQRLKEEDRVVPEVDLDDDDPATDDRY